jgi:hypothetical protein
LEGVKYDEARRHLRSALEWPEHLGQGRPYEPEERLVQYLLGHVEGRLGERDRARAAFEAVVNATGLTEETGDRLDLLAIAALAALGRTDELGTMTYDADTDVGRFASEMARALESSEDVSEVAARLAGEHAGLFEDLLGRMLLRALSLS